MEEFYLKKEAYKAVHILEYPEGEDIYEVARHCVEEFNKGEFSYLSPLGLVRGVITVDGEDEWEFD